MEFDCRGSVLIPSSLCARFSPSSCDWLNERSLNLPMSLTRAAVKFELLPPPEVAVLVAFLPLEPPQPAARSTSTATATTLRNPVRTMTFYQRRSGPCGKKSEERRVGKEC